MMEPMQVDEDVLQLGLLEEDDKLDCKSPIYIPAKFQALNESCSPISSQLNDTDSTFEPHSSSESLSYPPAIAKKQKRRLILKPSHRKKRRNRKRRQRESRVRRHANAIGVLATTELGFTLTNGSEYVVEDMIDENWIVRLTRDLKRLNIKRLFATDIKTASRVSRHVSGVVNDLLSIHWNQRYAEINCMFCFQINCHRWKAIRGLAQLVQYPVEPIQH